MGVFWVSLTLTHHEIFLLLGVFCGAVCSFYVEAPYHYAPAGHQVYKPEYHHQDSAAIPGHTTVNLMKRSARHCRCTVDSSCSLYGQCSQCECPIYDNPVRYSHCDCNILFFNPGLTFRDDCRCMR